MERLWKDGILKKRFSKKHKKKLSLARIGIPSWNKGLVGYLAGENHYNWKGGKSFEPYGLKFDNELKNEIRKRDNFMCQECGFSEKDLGYKLDVHHIDYNKQNNNKNNLVSLCRSCHSQTNFTRANWTDYFNNKIYAKLYY